MQDSLLWGETSERGKKRRADESLDDQDRFTRRFNQLALDYDTASIRANGQNAYVSQVQSSTGPAIEGERMHVDETKDKVFIHDLDAEVAEIEAADAEPKMIFIPDIERHLNAVPRQVFRGKSHGLFGDEEDDAVGRQVVLYSEPKSQVLQAEAAKRATTAAVGIHERHSEPETAHGYGQAEYAVEHDPDPDPMDIDMA